MPQRRVMPVALVCPIPKQPPRAQPSPRIAVDCPDRPAVLLEIQFDDRSSVGRFRTKSNIPEGFAGPYIAAPNPVSACSS